jgi:two-component system response regulator AtoC
MAEKRLILLVDDDTTALELIRDLLKPHEITVHLARSAAEARDFVSRESYQAVVTDLKMPDADGIELLEHLRAGYPEIPVIMLTGHATVSSAVEALKKGAFDYLSKPIQIEELLLVLEKAISHERLKSDNTFLRQELERRDSYLYETRSDELSEVYATVESLAGLNSTVLLRGESGTGKEVIARLIHRSGPRSRGNFVPINCGAIPESLIESELFGHEQGAFTDAKQRMKGKLEIADGGTLFLDEVDELPPRAQVSLLRFIQELVVVPLGSNRRIRVDVRIVAATNKNLEQLVQEERFRSDLYYRINVIPLDLPPLRRRREDILPLARWFLARFSEEHGRPPRSFSAEAEQALLSYQWPGNIRELRNCIERASIISRSSTVKAESLFLPKGCQEAGTAPAEECFARLGVMPLRELEERYIRWAVEQLDGNRSRAADALALSVRGLRNKLNRQSHEAHS